MMKAIRRSKAITIRTERETPTKTANQAGRNDKRVASISKTDTIQLPP